MWSDDGMICTGEVYKDHVMVTFAKGASLDNPHGLFNASLGGTLRRAIDVTRATMLTPRRSRRSFGRRWR